MTNIIKFTNQTSVQEKTEEPAKILPPTNFISQVVEANQELQVGEWKVSFSFNSMIAPDAFDPARLKLDKIREIREFNPDLFELIRQRVAKHDTRWLGLQGLYSIPFDKERLNDKAIEDAGYPVEVLEAVEKQNIWYLIDNGYYLTEDYKINYTNINNSVESNSRAVSIGEAVRLQNLGEPASYVRLDLVTGFDSGKFMISTSKAEAATSESEILEFLQREA